MEEIAKQQEDKMPEFAIKTQILARKAEEKKKLEKAKEQMHFQKLTEDKRDDAVEENTGIVVNLLCTAKNFSIQHWHFSQRHAYKIATFFIGQCECELGGGGGSSGGLVQRQNLLSR